MAIGAFFTLAGAVSDFAFGAEEADDSGEKLQETLDNLSSSVGRYSAALKLANQDQAAFEKQFGPLAKLAKGLADQQVRVTGGFAERDLAKSVVALQNALSKGIEDGIVISDDRKAELQKQLFDASIAAGEGIRTGIGQGLGDEPLIGELNFGRYRPRA